MNTSDKPEDPATRWERSIRFVNGPRGFAYRPNELIAATGSLSDLQRTPGNERATSSRISETLELIVDVDDMIRSAGKLAQADQLLFKALQRPHAHPDQVDVVIEQVVYAHARSLSHMTRIVPQPLFKGVRRS